MRALVILAALSSQAIADPPNDSKATAEQGWQAYQHHDLAKAESLTRDALARANDDADVVGAASYNLGRILEDRGDKPGAIRAYRDSLTARHNWVVRDRLRTLDRAGAESFDSYTPVAMKGPFSSASELCHKNLLEIYPSDVQAREALDHDCDAIVSVPIKTSLKVARPYEELRVVNIRAMRRQILIEVGGLWYAGSIDPFEDRVNCTDHPTVTGLVRRADTLEVDYLIDGTCSHRDSDWTWTERAFVVIGIGASHKPSMSAAYRLAVTETDTTDGKPHKQTMNLQRTATWTKDGAIDIAITRNSDPATRGRPPETSDLAGRHTLTFP